MRHLPRRTPAILLFMLLLPLSVAPGTAQEPRWDPVAAAKPLLQALSGTAQQFQVSGSISFTIDDHSQNVEFRVVRFDDESFDVELTHEDYAIAMRRRADATALALPKHGVVYVGTGPVTTQDRLSCRGMWQRLISSDSELSTVAFAFSFLSAADPEAFVVSVLDQAGFQYNAKTDKLETDEATLASDGAGHLHVTSNEFTLESLTTLTVPQPTDVLEWPAYKQESLPRDELETTLVRGVRRAGEILQPALSLRKPDESTRNVPHGRLTWKNGQRIATLWGTPEEIGTAHGQLLKMEASRCIDSVLYTFGTAHVIRTGKWFRQDLDDAYARLQSHIPERHQRETRAMARALGLPQRQAEILNVFPELFHCSGFAVFDSATVDGKLYHGRVLDYMTTIGLQDAATTFIVRPKDQIAFANVGYAGFIGSVSGMNARGISLGEMGGRGEGDWDGVPMATLMRRALEECETLPEVMELWENSPRTCEYYYVFADGKSNDAVGVAATPEKIEFIRPGEGHELLGAGITDAVVLSAGSRLEELRRRVQEKHGAIDSDIGMWLMSRPVAMESNLHNVLFVPADGILYVANAGHNKPAAEMPYVRIDLRAMLKTDQLQALKTTGGD